MTNKLTAGQVYALARGAGFSAPEAVTMTTIAYYESGWNADAHNPNASTGDNSYGLWQINMIGAMGPERRKAIGITSNDALFDPATNAKAARIIYKWQGFTAWSVYKHKTAHSTWNATRMQVEQAARKPGAVTDLPADYQNPNAGSVAGDPAAPADVPDSVTADENVQKDSTGFVGAIAGWFGKYLLLAALFVTGGLLLLMGFTQLPQIKGQLGGLASA